MAFTAGSIELAKAEKLGNILAHLFGQYGAAGMAGITALQTVEKQARKLGFGVSGITTGSGFPGFGVAGASGANTYPNATSSVFGSITAFLQNPTGLTRPHGITAGAQNGQTVGIYMRKFVRDGADVTIANSASGSVAGTTLGFLENTQVNKGFTATVYYNSTTTGNTYSIN